MQHTTTLKKRNYTPHIICNENVWEEPELLDLLIKQFADSEEQKHINEHPEDIEFYENVIENALQYLWEVQAHQLTLIKGNPEDKDIKPINSVYFATMEDPDSNDIWLIVMQDVYNFHKDIKQFGLDIETALEMFVSGKFTESEIASTPNMGFLGLYLDPKQFEKGKYYLLAKEQHSYGFNFYHYELTETK